MELQIGDKVYKPSRHGLRITVYEVVRVTKTLAILSNGTRIERTPSLHYTNIRGGKSYKVYGQESYLYVLTAEKEEAQALIDEKLKALSQTLALTARIDTWNRRQTDVINAVSTEDIKTLNSALETFVGLLNNSRSLEKLTQDLEALTAQ